MIHYHGTPITPREQLLRLTGRSFCVPWPEADRNDVEVCHEIGEGVMLDNGAFTIWQKQRDGKPLPPRLVAATKGDWTGFYDWIEPWLDFPTTWAVIPDVIDGDEEANDRLLVDWFQRRLPKGAPVWHMHESIDRLKRLAHGYQRVCVGSSGAYADVGDPRWHRRMEQAMNALCGSGPVPVWLHMLRGLSLCGSHYPFASADSVNVGRNHAGSHASPGFDVVAKATEIDARQCPARWHAVAPQLEMAA